MRWVAALSVFLLWLPGAAAAEPSSFYVVRYDHWSEEDERGWRDFIAGLGDADCHSVDQCLHDPANPFRASDPPGPVV